MSSTERALKKLIDRHLPSPSHMELTISRDRVLDALRSTPPHLQRTRIPHTQPPISQWRPVWSVAAAAVVLAAVVGTAIVWPRGAQVYAAGENGLQFTLADDSRVEMRAHSELAVDRAEDGTRIRLNRGSIIVNAAQQRAGRLYVQTKDMTVAVVGTVFVVNAADDGSRVSVIEGEVQVREAATETTLRPGEHVSSSPTMAARPVTEDIAWSRHADAHRAILESFMKGMAQTAGPRRPLADPGDAVGAAQAAGPEFEEAAVRECDPDNLPPTPPGARGGGANSFQMTPGRVYALCMTTATLIRTAYGLGVAGNEYINDGSRAGVMRFNAVAGLGTENGVMVRGGPDWVRSERYTIDAIANPSADAQTLSRTMLRSLLERRFQLKAHLEVEEIPAYSLTVAKGGLKMKPTEDGGCEERVFVPGRGAESPPPARSAADVRRGAKPSCGIFAERNGPNMVWVGGRATIGGEGLTGLAKGLALQLGRVRVFDKTGLDGAYSFILEFVLDENTPGLSGNVRPATEPSDIPRGPTIFAALEEQLGLTLEPTRGPREFVVIDHIERPSAN